MDVVPALSRFEQQLHLTRRQGRAVIARWSSDHPSLGSATLDSPADLPAWIWSLPINDADDVLRHLIRLAQRGDELASLTVLACLRPGLCSLAKRIGESLDEVVAEAAVLLFEYPYDRRRRVAAGFLLDLRKRFWVRRRRLAKEVLDDDPAEHLDAMPATGELGVQLSAAERLVDLVWTVWRAGQLDEDQARLIIETRVLGDQMAIAARRRGVTRRAAFERRVRAEARLARAAQRAAA
jgi:hypothetical protein